MRGRPKPGAEGKSGPNSGRKRVRPEPMSGAAIRQHRLAVACHHPETLAGRSSAGRPNSFTGR
jgi:hypothetical protein